MNTIITVLSTLSLVVSFILLGLLIVQIYNILFVKRNFKELKFKDSIVYDYEIFEDAYYSICKLYNFEVGDFKIVDFDSNYCVITIKNKYFQIDGDNMKYLYSQQDIIEERLCDTYLEYYSERENIETK